MTPSTRALVGVGSVALLTVIMILLFRIGVNDVTRTLSSVLVPGTPAARVLTQLDSLRIRFGADVGAIHDGLPSGSLFGPGKYVTAVIRSWRVNLASPFAEGIWLDFKFDDQAQLVEYNIRYEYTMF